MFRFGLSTDGLNFHAKKFLGHSHIGINKSAENQESRIGLVVDVETTGFDRQQDEIIEIAARLFCFNRIDGSIVWIGNAFEALNQPEKPIDAIIEKVTGLRNEDLEGHKINWPDFDHLAKQADIIIAHNAAFDRQFIERYTDSTKDKIWGCSFEQIDWSDFPSAKLVILSLCHGFFYDSHRALNDIDALIHLISMKPVQSQNTYLVEILREARKKRCWVHVINSVIETKELLRKNGYRWVYETKFWRKKICIDDLETEKKFLNAEVNLNADLVIEVVEIPHMDNFKD
ncbi:MAG: DNA polymerase III subunit epsilon [Calditrichaeota bacterium]|nr:DNA polymerase III subunit epsilon [Calditrichota bacterium]